MKIKRVTCPTCRGLVYTVAEVNERIDCPICHYAFSVEGSKANDCENCGNKAYIRGYGGPCSTCEDNSAWCNNVGSKVPDVSEQDELGWSPYQEPIDREVLAFLRDLCHPEQYGHAVTQEVRARANELINKMEAHDASAA